jgi:hypothetical protein
MGDGSAAEEQAAGATEERIEEAPSYARASRGEASWGGERRERLGKGLASANRVSGERERESGMPGKKTACEEPLENSEQVAAR